MTAHIVQQPAGSKEASDHYIDTIKNPVLLSRIRPFLSSEQLSELPESIALRNSVSIWGVRPGKDGVNIKKWEKLQTGDIALFSGDKRIFSSGVVIHKLHNKDLGIELWGPENFKQAPFEYLYFLDEITPQNISYENFNRAAGYKLNNIIQGFDVLNEEKSENILFAFDLYSQQYYPPVDFNEYVNTVKSFDPNKPLDAKVESNTRTEQGYLREQLFGKNAEMKCCICDKKYPVGFLVAAHIKKRANCSNEERLDVQNIVASMCKFGCDELYERGYIGIDDTGTISIINPNVSNQAIKNYLKDILGKSCAKWSPSTRKYFEWHRTQHLKK